MVKPVVSAAPAPWSWSAPLHRSRCGASHRRRAVPCQDASLTASLRSADGVAVALMAVADGHGGSRYWLSDVGSRLACELAIRIAAQDLADQPLAGGGPAGREAVRRWLAEELPPRLLAAWHTAIEADWRARPLPAVHAGEAFSSQTYGSTLALVVLTPHWWAHTGLGDWDLVLLSNGRPDRIVSQETGDDLHGEATESLCLARASHCFAARTAVYPLSGDQRQACGLVLSTDGLRKSCATDADHLALSRFLLEEAQPEQAATAAETSRLDASLDRISREGSGDDVSVAIACFGALQPGTPPSRASEQPASRPLPAPPPLPPLPPETMEAQARPRRRGVALVWPISLLLLGSCGLAALAWLRLLPAWHHAPAPTARANPPAAVLTAEQQQGLRREIKRLCSHSERIAANLNARNSQFRATGTGPAPTPQQLLLQHDWLGALIALSRPGAPGLAPLQSCPELEKALRQHWQTTLQLSPQPGQAVNLRTVEAQQAR